MEFPFISVIVPVYNVERYLERCLDSILAQTFSDFEVICVNDNSPDNSPKILEKYKQKDSRITVINQDNQGLSMARNNGLKKALGKYVYFLDSDDFIHPQLLEITHYFAEKYQADMVNFNFFFDYYREQKKHTEAHEETPKPVNSIYHSIEAIPFKITTSPLQFFREKKWKRHDWTMHYNSWARLYRRDLLNGLSFIPGIYFEDYPHTIAVCSKHPKTVLLNEPLYYYTYNVSSICNQCRREITVRHIRDYHKGLHFLYETYRNASREDVDFLVREIFAHILKMQLNGIRKSSVKMQPELYSAFIHELNDLNSKGCVRLSWTWRKLRYYWQFKKLIRQGKKVHE